MPTADHEITRTLLSRFPCPSSPWTEIPTVAARTSAGHCWIGWFLVWFCIDHALKHAKFAIVQLPSFHLLYGADYIAKKKQSPWFHLCGLPELKPIHITLPRGQKNKANHAGAFTVHILHACKCHQMKSISGRNGFQHSVRGIYGPPLVYNCCCRNPSFLGFRFFAFGTPRPRPLPRPFPLELALAFRRMPRSTTGTVT